MQFFPLITALTVLAAGSEAHFPRALQERLNHLDQLSRPPSRIVNGENADVAEAPFQVSMQQDYLGIFKSHFCGASFIAPTVYVTAAHCTDGQAANSIVTRFGTNKRSKAGPQGDRKSVRVIQHPEYNSDTISNDISLVVVDKAVSPTENVAFVTYDTEHIGDAVDVTVYGWGKNVGSSNNLPEDLQRGHLKTMSNEACHEIWGEVNPIGAGMLCAFDRKGATGATTACNGDSGGPLVLASNKKLVGIVSWGENGCAGNYPNVYTRVSEYVDWIKKNLP